MEKQKNSVVSFVEEIISRHFAYLVNDFEYELSFQDCTDNIFEDCLSAVYTNKKLKREILVSYTKGTVSDEIRFTFSVSINIIPFYAWGGSLALSKYLKSKNKDFISQLVNSFDKEKADKIVEKLALAIRNETLEIIEGKIWLDKFYYDRDE